MATSDWWQLWYAMSPQAAKQAERQFRPGSAPARSWRRPQPHITQRARRARPTRDECDRRAHGVFSEEKRRTPVRLAPRAGAAMRTPSTSHASAHVALPDPASPMAREWRAAARRSRQPAPHQKGESSHEASYSAAPALVARKLRREFRVRPTSAGASASYDVACGRTQRFKPTVATNAQRRVQWPVTPPRRGLSRVCI